MIIDIKDLCNTYVNGEMEVPVLHDVCLSVDEGEFVSIMGPSGSGKSTLMNIIGCLDRPTSGIVVFARTDKALSRLSEMFRTGKIEKHYWAITDKELPAESGELHHYLYRDTVKNKSFAYSPAADGGKPALRGVRPEDLQEAKLRYVLIGQSERYVLYDINLLTGRHHQIRAQLAACGVHIKGDLKYGFPRSNADGGICLHSHEIMFPHPVGGAPVHVIAPPPEDTIWSFFGKQ